MSANNGNTATAMNVNNRWVEPADLLGKLENTITDLRTEIEQLQETVNDAPSLIGSTAAEPFVERYARVNITKGAKGDYRHETTVSVTMTGGDWTTLQEEIAAGLRAADGAARIEIEQRLGWDQHPREADDDPAF